MPYASHDTPPPRVECPACSGTDLMVSNSSNAETTYLRCFTCGEVWNALRHIATPQRPVRHR